MSPCNTWLCPPACLRLRLRPAWIFTGATSSSGARSECRRSGCGGCRRAASSCCRGGTWRSSRRGRMRRRPRRRTRGGGGRWTACAPPSRLPLTVINVTGVRHLCVPSVRASFPGGTRQQRLLHGEEGDAAASLRPTALAPPSKLRMMVGRNPSACLADAELQRERAAAADAVAALGAQRAEHVSRLEEQRTEHSKALQSSEERGRTQLQQLAVTAAEQHTTLKV